MPRNVRIVPAILTDDHRALEHMLRQSATFTDYVQVDVMDGRFVPSKSITWENLSGLSIKVKWEAHLMIEDPAARFADYQRAGAEKVIFHYEAVKSPEETIAAARRLNLKVGIAINPETPSAAVIPVAAKVDSILLLAVHPGYYGAKFLPEVLAKIGELLPTKTEIGIDGGIKENNVAEIARTGLNTIFVGSAIFLQADPAAAYRRLQDLALKD